VLFLFVVAPPRRGGAPTNIILYSLFFFNLI